MFTHYIDFDVVAGASLQDIARVHGYILSASHKTNANIQGFDLPQWCSKRGAGNCLRLFAPLKGLEALISHIQPLLKAGAATHSDIQVVPSDAPLSDYHYKRVRTCKLQSASYQRRQAARNPDAPLKYNKRPSKRPVGAYRLIMQSQSNGQTYPLYIQRVHTHDNPGDSSTSNSKNALGMRVPVISADDTKPSPEPKIVVAQSAARATKDDLPIRAEKPAQTKTTPPKETSKHPLLEQIESVFGKQGLIVRDGGHHNPVQLQYALAVGKTLLSTRSDNAPPVGLLEAATGVGKTLGYLVPTLLYAKEHNARVVVSTHTKQLQQQLYNEDAIKAAQYVKELTGQTITINRRFGRHNYLSITACDNFLEQTKDENEDDVSLARDFVQRVRQWVKKARKALIPLDEFLDSNNLDVSDIPSNLDYSQLAIGYLSSKEEIESYEAIIQRTNDADLLIVNHALSIINARSWMGVLERGERKDIYVFDEADKLDDTANSIAYKSISIRKALKAISQGVSKYSEARANDMNAFMGELDKVTASMFEKGCSERLTTPEFTSTLKKLLAYAHDAAFNAGRSVILGKSSFNQQLAKTDFLDSYNTLSFALALIEEGAPSLVSASPVMKYPQLVVGQDKPARVLSRLWALHREESDNEIIPTCPSIALLFTSATIRSRNGQFKGFANSVGIISSTNKATGLPYHNAVTDQWLSFENKNFGEMQFVLPDQRIPSPTIINDERNEDDEKVAVMSSRWLNYSASMIEKAQTQKGRTLVLTNSYKASCELRDRLVERDLKNVVTHKKGENLNHYLPQFLEHENSILLSHGAWEGLNLPGCISHIVIPRIPYAPPDTGRNKLRELALRSRGLDDERSKKISLSESTDNVVRKLTQGVGRGIRSKTDSVTVWLADPRFPLPDSYLDSLDPLLMQTPKRQRKDLRGFIPKRFVVNYSAAPIFVDGDLYEVAV